jgi:hypothetical protein
MHLVTDLMRLSIRHLNSCVTVSSDSAPHTQRMGNAALPSWQHFWTASLLDQFTRSIRQALRTDLETLHCLAFPTAMGL